MTVYIIFIILCVVHAIRFDRFEEKSAREQCHYWGLCAYLICLSGFSYGLGGDKMFYLQAFEVLNTNQSLWGYIRSEFFRNSFMPLWSALNYACKSLFDSFYLLQFIESAVVNICVCYIVRESTNKHFLFLLLYFLSEIYFQFNTEIMREGFSIAIGLFAFRQYEQRNYMRYLLLGLLALSFHISAIVLFLFPLARVTITFRWLPFLCLAAVILWIAKDLAVQLATNIIPHSLQGVSNKVLSYTDQMPSMVGFMVILLRYLILPFLIGKTVLSSWEDRPNYTFMNHIFTFQVMLGMIICLMGFGFARFFNYIRIYYLIWVVEFIIMTFEDKRVLLLRLSLLCMVCFFSIAQWFTSFPAKGLHFYDLFVPYTYFADSKTYNLSDRLYIYSESMNTK